MDTHTKVIVFLLMEVLTTVALESQPIDQSHVLSAKETVQSVDQEIPTARVLQLSERKDSSFRKEEHQPPEGLKGSYGYRDENGDLVVRFYAADDSGYRIVKEERYPSSHIGRDGYDNNKHRTNFYDPDHIRHRTYPRNYHNDFFSRNYRPSSKTYRNYDKQYPNIHKNTHGFDAYYPTHKFRARDNSQYPNSVYQYNENIRPSEFPEFHKHRNNFNHGHHYAFPTQFFSNNPQRQFFQNQHPVFSQTYDDFHRFKNNIQPLDDNYYPFNTLQRKLYPIDYDGHYHENFGKRYPSGYSKEKRQNNNIDYNSYYNQNFDRDFNRFKKQIPNDEFYTDNPRNYNSYPSGYYNQNFERNLNSFRGRIPNNAFFPRGFPLYLVTPADNVPNLPQNIPNFEIVGAKIIPGGIVPIYNIHRFRGPQNTRVSYSPNHSVLNSAVGYTTNHEYPDLINERNVWQNNVKPIQFDNYLSEFPTHNNALRKLYFPNLYRNQHLFRPRFGFSNIYGLAF